MRILPRPRREAIFEIYGFCRIVDDIADRDGPRTERLKELQGWRAEIDALYRGTPSSRLHGLATAAGSFGLDRNDLLAIIDGMEMDVIEDIRAPDFELLDLYCDRVASAVGRLCVKVFGMGLEEGKELAHHLGRALQLTNILRDLDEDAAIGRLYLPREALQDAGIADNRSAIGACSTSRLAAACAPVVERARGHFRHADAIMRTLSAPIGTRAKDHGGSLQAEARTADQARMVRRHGAASACSRLGLMWILARHAIV